MRRALPALPCIAALLLFGCGGGGDEGSSTTSGTTEPTTTTAQPREGPGQGRANGGGGSSEEPTRATNEGSSSQRTATVRVPPISSAPVEGSTRPAPGVKTVKGGDNSVQEYGVESSEAERTQAATALQGYLNARAEGDWRRVCSYLARKPIQQLEESVRPQGEGEGSSGCAETMQTFGRGTSESSAITEVLSLRGGGDVPGDPSYLIYTAPPGQTLFSMPMYLEGGEWKVGLAVASELPV